MADTSIPTFNNKDQLLNIRTKSLNPAIMKLNALEGNQQTIRNNLADVTQKAAAMQLSIESAAASINTLSEEMKTTFTDCVVIGDEKVIEYYHKHTGVLLGSCDLTPMFADNGVFISSATSLKKRVSNLYFQGTGVNIATDPTDPTKGIITINQGGGGGGGSIHASIHGQGTKEIDSINITGPTPGTSIEGTQLNLHLPDGRFEGFYSSMTELNKIIPSAEPNQSFAYLKIAAEHAVSSGDGWMPMFLQKDAGFVAQWVPVHTVGSLQVVRQDANGNYIKEGFSNTIVHSGNIKVVDGNIFIHDDAVTGSFVENDDPTTLRVEAKPPVDQGNVGHYQFLGPKGSVRHESIPNSDKHKVIVDLNKSTSMTGTITKTGQKPVSAEFSKVNVIGAIGSSKVENSTLTIELPKNTAKVEGDKSYSKVTKTQVKGNKGLSKMDSASNELTIDIPFLKAGKKTDAVFEETHRSYKWNEPFQKWDDDFKWNPIKEGLERRWEDDEAWEDGNPWATFSDTVMDDVAGLKFDGNVEYRPPAEGDANKVATVEIPYLQGGHTKSDGSINKFDAKEIVFPKTAKVDESTGVVDLTDAMTGDISGYVLKETEKVMTGDKIQAVFAYGPSAQITKHTDTTTGESFSELSLDLRPFSRVSIDSGNTGEEPSKYDALEIRGSDKDLKHSVVDFLDAFGKAQKMDVVDLIGFDRFPGQFTSTGTPDFSIDAPGPVTRFVYVAPGTSTKTDGVNYLWNEPYEDWADEKRWNALGAESPSKDLAMKGGWIMNLFTPAQEGQENRVTQVFYPVDDTGVRIRVGSTGDIGTKEWNMFGAFTGKIGEAEKILESIQFPDGAAEWGVGDEHRVIKVKDQRSKYSRRDNAETSAYQWNSPFENIKFTDPGNNITKDDDTNSVLINMPDVSGFENRLRPLEHMLPPPAGFTEGMEKDPDTHGQECGWGYAKPDAKKESPRKEGGVWVSYFIKATDPVGQETPVHQYHQTFYQNGGEVWYRSGSQKDVATHKWEKINQMTMGTWKNDAEGNPEMHTLKSLKFEGIDDSQWDKDKYQLTVPILKKSDIDDLNNRFPKFFPADGTPEYNIDSPGNQSRFVFIKPGTKMLDGVLNYKFKEPDNMWADENRWNRLDAESLSTDIVKIGGWVLNLYTATKTGSINPAYYTQMFYPVDDSGVKVRAGDVREIGKKEWKSLGGSDMSFSWEAGKKQKVENVKLIKSLGTAEEFAKDLIKWDEASNTLSIPLVDPDQVDKLESRFPDVLSDTGPTVLPDVNYPVLGNNVMRVAKGSGSDLPALGGTVQTFFKSGSGSTQGTCTQVFVSEDGSSMGFRAGQVKAEGERFKLDTSWRELYEKPKAAFYGTTSMWFWNLLYQDGPKPSSTRAFQWAAPSTPKNEKQIGCFAIKPVFDNLGVFKCYTATDGEASRHYVQIPYTSQYNLRWGVNLGVGTITSFQEDYHYINKIEIEVIRTLSNGTENSLFKSVINKDSDEWTKFLKKRQSLFISTQQNLNAGDKVSFLVRFRSSNGDDVKPEPILNVGDANKLSALFLNDRYGQFKNFFAIEESSNNDIAFNMALSYRDLWGGNDMPIGLDYMAGHSVGQNKYVATVKTYDTSFVNVNASTKEM